MSQLIGIPVIDSATGKRIGYSADITAGIREMYPKVGGIIARRGFFRGKAYIPWKNVVKVVEDKAIIIENGSLSATVPEGEILLKETFWDKQIVDVSGSKVVRINDLHLLREDNNMWVVHIDIGFKGLIRRLGWTNVFEPLVRWLFSYDLKDRLISWKYVQPITAGRSDLVSLKTPSSRLSELHPADLADILIDLGTEERIIILKALSHDLAASTLNELPMNMRVQTAELLDQEQLANIVREMPMDEAVDLLAHFPRKKVNALFSLLPQDKVNQIRELLSLSERVAGSLMTVEFVAVKSDVTAGQVIERLKAESKNREIYYVYVVDESQTLIGITTLRRLLSALPEKPVTEIMRKRIAKVRVDTDVRDVAQIFFKYDFMAVPVVDKHNKIQGIIAIKDALEAVFPQMREEMEEAT